jgi:IS605 OrfB family transposase
MISYNTELLSENPQDLADLRTVLQQERLVFNLASVQQFPEKKLSIVVLHSKVYGNVRATHPEIPSSFVVHGERGCLSAYRAAKSNKHRLKVPILKKNPSIRLDNCTSSCYGPRSIRITTSAGRKTFTFKLYPKLVDLLAKYTYASPLIYEREGKVFISLPFKNEKPEIKPTLVLGVDLGMRRVAACSDGRIIIDRKFNGDKRKLLHLKRHLQSCGSKSARIHLKKLRRKEHNRNVNQSHLVANEVLKTSANAIALENLKGLKARKFKFQNKRAISQVPFFNLRRILTYKAENAGMSVFLVSPAFTSQDDSITTRRDGERRGCRYYAKNGLVYDADLNGSRNIGRRSNHPVSYGNILDGQALVKVPYVCKSSLRQGGITSPLPLGAGL